MDRSREIEKDISEMESNSDCEDNEIPIWQEPRCEPLGAAKEALCDEHSADRSPASLRALQEEQEILSSSVFSLSSHLAQIEFRLRQIMNTPPDLRDDMLRALEEYTVRACGTPDARTAPPSCPDCVELDRKVRSQRARVADFMRRLKTQLGELDRCASSGGEPARRALVQRLHRQLGGAEQAALCAGADLACAAHRPDAHLSRDEVVDRLQTHVEEMQKFIDLMKDEPGAGKPARPEKPSAGKARDDLRGETVDLVRRASNMMQIVAVSHFGCSLDANGRYERQSSATVTHWGNLRAKLEMSIDAVLRLALRERTSQPVLEGYNSDSEEDGVVIHDAPLTTTVRRHLAVNLRDLLQHGLASSESTSLVPLIGCFPVRRSSSSHSMHIWELIIRYYQLNDGDRFNSTPARKLSQSFNLDIVGGTAITNKQSLLSAIESIVASHTPYKRSYDAQFKAWVCAALNAQKLVLWLNTILKCRSLIDVHYSSTSYVVNTGFQDALQSMDRLTAHHFDLPVDLAVKQFQNIKDVFM